MAELRPAPFSDLVTRLFLEPQTQGALFELPHRKWWLPSGDGPDLRVRFQGRQAGNPCGPAAGPHTQMAQNLLLSYAAGGRILELKTVQLNDRLEIPRPCIDMTNVGYNVEWSQELLVEQSLREYVAGAMLIQMFRASRALTGGALEGPAGAVLYDLSVGYDLKGIKSGKVCGFLDKMRDAGRLVESLRSEIPRAYKDARQLAFETHLSDTITLSTFHGCPADEIESICEFLIAEQDFDVIVKMNPPTLGKQRLEHLLHDVLGYSDLTVNPTAYSSAVSFADSVDLCRRLADFAARRGRRLGLKFSNTLEVLNHRDFFTSDNKVMYLSGQPLHVITMTLTDELRRRIGPDVPISFSAGIDKQNFALAVACGFVPITISSDLLRPGGYGRLGSYLSGLEQEMRKVGAATVDEFVLRRFDGERRRDEARERRREEDQNPDRKGGAGPERRSDKDQNPDRKGGAGSEIRRAALANTSVVAAMTREDPRYRAERNAKVPKRIDSHLVVFDCVTCDKCLPVCPNAANFIYPTPLVAFDDHDLVCSPDGTWREAHESRRFEITKEMQIACFADFCNECGNCDTFCPEYGGPYIEKPSFFGTIASWEAASPRDGFVVERRDGAAVIRGRIKGRVYTLTVDDGAGVARLDDGVVEVELSTDVHAVRSVRFRRPPPADDYTIDMWVYHTLRHLLVGVLDERRVNQVNVVSPGSGATE